MTDLDLIQRNQITIMRALALLMPKEGINACHSLFLLAGAQNTQEYVNAKLSGTPFPSMREAAEKTGTNPWPDDLVDAACRRAGKEEEPL